MGCRLKTIAEIGNRWTVKKFHTISYDYIQEKQNYSVPRMYLRCTDKKMSISNTLECQSNFGGFPYPLFVYFALRVKKRYQILGT